MSTPILPHIAIKPTRLCDGDHDVNCFSDLQGCQTSIPDLSSGIMCGDDGEWSVSLRFVGNGVWLTTGTTCLDDTCKWTIDDDSSEGCTDWVPQETPGGIGRQSIIHATGLDGADDTKHTLTISSLSVSSDGPHLHLYDVAMIYTGPDTPVHPGDLISISPHYSEVKVEGNWSAVELDGRISEERIQEDWVGSWRMFQGGEGSISVGIIGDSFQMPGWWYDYNEDYDVMDGNVPVTTNITLDGKDVSDQMDDSGIIPLDPGGWHNVGYKLAFDRDTGLEYVMVSNIIYHPLDNITRIRDIIPEALVAAFNDSPPSSNNFGCAVSEPAPDSGAGSYLHESTGAFFLLPMILMWSILRLKL